MTLPSLSDLVGYLFWLAWYTVGYKLGTNPWDKVELYQSKIKSWFTSLKNRIDSAIGAAKGIVESWAQEWFDFLEAWRLWLKERIGQLQDWIDVFGSWTYDWLIWGYETLQYYISYLSAWLKWFVADPYNALRYYIGGAIDWLQGFWSDPLGYLEYYLGSAWAWLKWFFSDPYNALRHYVGGAIDWLQGFWSNPLGYLEYYLGSAWAWLKGLAGNFAAWVLAVLGAVWNWIVGVYNLGYNSLTSFLSGPITFWTDIWSRFRGPLADFLDRPGVYVLAAIRDVFLAWLEDLLADEF